MCGCQVWAAKDADELQRIGAEFFSDIETASMILHRSGWKRSKLPQGAGLGESFWFQVVDALSSGAAPGFCAVLTKLLFERPHNGDLLELARQVGHAPARGRLDGFTEHVADLLDGISSVGAVADSLGVQGVAYNEALRMAVAKRLFASDVGLDKVAGAFRGSSAFARVGVEIADRVFPFKDTVPARAVDELAPLLHTVPAGDVEPAPGLAPAVALRARETPIAFWHVIGASCRSTQTGLPTTIDPDRVVEPERTAAELAAAIRRELLEAAGHYGGPEPGAGELDAALARIERLDGRRIAVLLPPHLAPEVVRYLREQFRGVVFVVLKTRDVPVTDDETGADDETRADGETGADDIPELEPIADPNDEDEFYWYYRAMTGSAPRSSAPRSMR